MKNVHGHQLQEVLGGLGDIGSERKIIRDVGLHDTEEGYDG